MTKKFKPKAPKDQNPTHFDITSTMMTEQEEKMFYANKKLMTEPNGHHYTHKKDVRNSSINQQVENQREDDQNIGPIQFSSLNQNSAQQITDFINKLIAKNKITSKNAFDVPLIHLEQMEDFRASLNQNTWKRLSSTLENDYKIYGYRVDAAHTITYKMVESIARHEATAQEVTSTNRQSLPKIGQSKKQQNNDFLSTLIDNSINENVSRNKLNVDYTKFIEKNQKLLNVSHIEAYFSCNPGLQKTKRKFDQQGLRALLLNNINLRNGCELKLDQHRKYDINANQVTKKQNIQNENQEQNQQINSNIEVSQFFQKVFDQKDENNMQIQHCVANIFDQIHQFNVKEGKACNDDFLKFQRLYKIVSGDHKNEKKAEIKKNPQKLPQVFKQNLKEHLIQQQQQNLQVKKSQLHNFENPSVKQEQKEQEINQQVQDISQLKNFEINQNIQEKEYPQNINQQLHQASKIDILQQKQFMQPYQTEIVKSINQISSKKDGHQTIIQKQSNLIEQQSLMIEEQSHVLGNKNFQMHQMNLDNLDQQSNQKQSLHQTEYTGKFKNIQDYIKMKIPRLKQQKKPKIQMDQLTSEQLANKLFDRKYKKKKNQTKDLISIKEENLSLKPKKKTNFTKILKPSSDLQRSVVFKKSITQQRTFNTLKQKIINKLENREKNKNLLEETEALKKKKGKKIAKIFDLPIYQFQRQDTNFINPFQEINPETYEIQFSSLFIKHFPSFVNQSYVISNDFLKKKLQIQKELQAKKKENEKHQKMSQMQNPQNNQQFLREGLFKQKKQDQKNKDESEQNIQPDISFIHDELGRIQGRSNQVAIREAKQKVRKIMIQMLSEIRQKKTKNRKVKKNKISYKQIYESYYRQEGFISPALCFLTILHLANQNNLILQGREDGTDFKISIQEDNQIKQLSSQKTIDQERFTVDQSQLLKPQMISEQFQQKNEKEVLKYGEKIQVMSLIQEE